MSQGPISKKLCVVNMKYLFWFYYRHPDSTMCLEVFSAWCDVYCQPGQSLIIFEYFSFPTILFVNNPRVFICLSNMSALCHIDLCLAWQQQSKLRHTQIPPVPKVPMVWYGTFAMKFPLVTHSRGISRYVYRIKVVWCSNSFFILFLPWMRDYPSCPRQFGVGINGKNRENLHKVEINQNILVFPNL